MWNRTRPFSFYLLRNNGGRRGFSTPAAKGNVSPSIYKFFERAFRYSRDGFYIAVVVGGLTICGTVLFTVVKELFVSNSVKNLVETCNAKIMADPVLQSRLGEPLRFEYCSGQRIPVSIIIQDEVGVKMQCQYKVFGTKDSGIVQVEFIQDPHKDASPSFLDPFRAYLPSAVNQIFAKDVTWTDYYIFVTTNSGFNHYTLKPPSLKAPESRSWLVRSLSWIFSGFS